MFALLGLGLGRKGGLVVGEARIIHNIYGLS